MAELRRYGESTTILFPLIDRSAVDFDATPVTFAAGDTKIIKDEAAAVNTTNNPDHRGLGIYSLVLTAAEMSAARIMITVIDSATKDWEDQAVIIETYGNASAQHKFDLGQPTQSVNVSTWLGTAVTVSSTTSLPEVDAKSVSDSDATADSIEANIGFLDASIVSLNDLSAAEVNAEVVDVLKTDTISELGGVPSATPTFEDAVMWLYMLFRNETTQSSSTFTVKNDAGTSIGTQAVSDTAGVAKREKAV
jgi:hypothetical protein